MIPKSRLGDIHHFKTIHRYERYSSDLPEGWYNIIQIRWKPVKVNTWFGTREIVPEDTEFYFVVNKQDTEYKELYNWLMSYMKTEDESLNFNLEELF